MSSSLTSRLSPAFRPVQTPYAQHLLDLARKELRARVSDARTEEIYSAWIRRYLEFAAPESVVGLDELVAGAFLTRLVLADDVNPIALKRARRALAFLETVVLRRAPAQARPLF